MNRIPIATIKQELGEKGWAKIEELTAFLFSATSNTSDIQAAEDSWREMLPTEGRFAPSIVTRSELEVFGFSMPRFCFRIYFQGSEDFVNCRRLKMFHEQVLADPKLCWGSRNTELPDEERNPLLLSEVVTQAPVQELIEKSTCIADCLLSPPERFSKPHFHVITVALDREYGEVASQTTTRKTTPFVKTIHFGGGLCAQASAFVCTAILHEHAERVFGLGEITALTSKSTLKELMIDGLSEWQLVDYFQQVRLNASVQVPHPQKTESRYKHERDLLFEQTLNAYSTSAMPVIVLVDRERLSGASDLEGESIYRANKYSMPSARKPFTRHSITVIGCRRRTPLNASAPGGHRSQFLFHDSAAMPFMHATLSQLSQVGLYTVDGFPSAMRHPTLIPVTPPEVKMPLMWWKLSSKESRRGLLDIAIKHKEPFIPIPGREFVLSQLQSIPYLRIRPHFDKEYRENAAELLKVILPCDFAKAVGWDSTHWVWLECSHNVVKIWDAELQPDASIAPPDATKYLRGALYTNEKSQLLLIGYPPDGSKVAINSSAVTLTEDCVGSVNTVQSSQNLLSPLLPALISSFTVLGAEQAKMLWPVQTKFVEVYACMQTDLETLFLNVTGNRRNMNAVSALADEFQASGSSLEFANNLRRIFEGREIVALATFIPEIMSPHKSMRTKATNAIKFLIQVARHLRNETRPFVIELVTGSRLHGVWRAETDDGPVFAVNRLNEEEAINLLLEGIESVARFAQNGDAIQLALEQEPGPLFTINNRSSLLALCEALNNPAYAHISKSVGINLDVPHWAFLSDVNLDWLQDSKQAEIIRNRIIHAHISDHGKGHFCDNAIAVVHGEEEFQKWIDFLGKLSLQPRPANCPAYSGFISCEMEACKDISFVQRSVRSLGVLLGRE